MDDRLFQKGAQIAQRRTAKVIDALMQIPLPPGISADRRSGGVDISGKRLRRLMVDSIQLRALGALVKGVLR
jgi:hypothetical protein